jgi:protein tyrosine kinase modulator
MTTDYFNVENEESSFDLSMLVAMAKRRFFFFFIPALFGLLISFVVVSIIPPRYESFATVLVESQQIPVELVQSTVTSNPNQRITIIKQRVMTRSNLLKIIDKYNVFEESRKKLSVSKLIAQMEKLISLRVITSDVSNNNKGSTIAFKVSFRHESPAIAAKVANELVTLFLSENVKTRTARASETTEFLEQEANKLRDQLVIAETAISEFKQLHSDALPEQLSLRMGILERTQSEIKALRLQVVSLRDERKYLDIELAAARSGSTKPDGTPTTTIGTTEEELKKTEDALTQALTRLTERHPDIKSLRRQVSALEEKLLAEQASEQQNSIETDKGPIRDPALQRLIERLQIRKSSNATAMKTAQGEIASLKTKAVELEAKVLKTPEVERDLTVLVRNHLEILAKYRELEAKQGKAKLAQNLEEEKKAERFLMLEPPVTPTEPVWPNRLKFFGIGAFLSFATGLGTAVLMELVDRRIRTAKELEHLLKSPPLAIIPMIKTKRDIQKKRYKLGALLLTPTVIFGCAITAVHFLYKPLDLFFYKGWAYLQKLNILPF